MKSKLEIVKADKGLRNRVVAALIAVAVLGAVCIRALNWTLDELARSAEPASEAAMGTLRTLFAFLTTMMAVTLIGAGTYLAFFSAKILKLSRFPPVGFRVIKDTRVVTGKQARTRGVAGIGLATLLILAGSTLPVLAWRLMSVLSAGTLK